MKVQILAYMASNILVYKFIYFICVLNLVQCQRIIVLILLLPFMLLTQVLSNAHAATEDIDVMFASSIIEIKGHLLQAIENKRVNDLEHAIPHTVHPTAELYPNIKDRIAEKDPQLANSIENKLLSLQKDARVLTVEEFNDRVDEINSLLHKALFNYDIIASDKLQGVGFWASVLLQVIDDASDEYEESDIEEGKVKNVIEWQDAIGFVTVLNADIFPNMLKGKLDQGLSNSLEQLLASLLEDMKSMKSIESISSKVRAINDNLRPLIEEEEGPSIPKIKDLLTLALNAYQAGKFDEEEKGELGGAQSNYEKAKEYITLAYEKHFLPLKQYIESKDHELMSSTENMLKDELLMLIDKRVSVEDIKSKIDELNTNIDKIIAIGVIPEFPLVTWAVFVSAMLVVLMLTYRGNIRFNLFNSSN